MAISPRITKGALVRPAATGDPLAGDAIVFQFNPDELTRRLEQRFGRTPRETISFTLEFDAADALEMPDENPTIVQHGIYPALAALQTLMHPSVSNVPGWLESFLGIGGSSGKPPPALFVWGEQRAVPVRITRLDISEEQHDPALNPIRASVRVVLKVVTDRDLPKDDTVGQIWRAHLEQLRDMAEFGFRRLP